MVHANTSAVKWLLMTTLALIWGSSFILMKRGLEDFHPGQVASIRMLTSFLCLFPFVIRKSNEIKKNQWKYIFATGLVGNGIPAFLFATAQTHVPSAMAGLLNSLTPVFTLVVGYFFFHSKAGYAKVAGVLIGLVGATGLILNNAQGDFFVDSFYPLLIVLACVGYAFSVNIIRNKLHEVESLNISGFALCLVGPPSGIYLFTTDFITRLEQNPHAWGSLGYVLLLGIFGTAISIVLFNYLIKMSGAVFASSVTYLIPVVAMLWGLADQENMGLIHLLALGAILTGVYLINLNIIPKKAQ
jgi:drug/metabolite transporter (DMT)-like permease